MSGKRIRHFLRGDLEFFTRDAEVNVRTCRIITEERNFFPVNFDKGIDGREITTGESENDLAERRSGTFDELGDCM